ncbi:MAG TPA: succinate dehydrogenase assembly factor 2 [Stellaceae bacterium]|nr:succinate dehydrogenase assembly factor 2 [Stellaceae bacterium]
MTDTDPPQSDTVETRRKRLLFRSWHRGTKETDLLLGSFAERYLPEFGEAQLDTYETLIEEHDANLFDWMTRRTVPPAVVDSDVLRLLLAFDYTARSA